jgi:UDP-glucose 4-epimerase
MAQYLVTGGAGFIGGRLASALTAGGHRVRVLDDLSGGGTAPAGCELLRADVVDRDAVRRGMEGVAGCFHLAAVASVERCTQDWAAAHRTNIGGTVTVLEAARDLGLPVVMASSAALYGDPLRVPVAESTPARPLSAYGLDKLAGEEHARVGAALFALRSVALRLFNVYGPGQDPASPYSGVISIFARRALDGRPLVVHGDGAQVRDFVHVDDVVRAFLAAMAHAEAEPGALVLNVGTGRATTIGDLARLIAELAGSRAGIEHGPPRAGDIGRSLADPALARERIGFEARTPIEEGLRDTLAWLASSTPGNSR